MPPVPHHPVALAPNRQQCSSWDVGDFCGPESVVPESPPSCFAGSPTRSFVACLGAPGRPPILTPVKPVPLLENVATDLAKSHVCHGLQRGNPTEGDDPHNPGAIAPNHQKCGLWSRDDFCQPATVVFGVFTPVVHLDPWRSHPGHQNPVGARP
jgi:hypothetical protein